MFVRKIKSIITALPESQEKELLFNNMNILEAQCKKTEAKHFKVNEDKLILSQLLTKINQELQESADNEKRFIASVSHELRTPLTAILGYSELLDDTTLNNTQKRYLDNIVQSSNHLLALISDLLDVAKLEDNRIELSLKEFDFDDMLNDCVNLIRSRVNNGVEIITDIPLMDYRIISDDKRLKQIFINLLSNAAKFTKKGSIHLYVKDIEELEHQQVKIVVNVDDTGDGVPKEIMDTIFNPFQSTDKTQGTGLGLYISQRLAQLMEGMITFESKQGIGTSFSVTIMVKKLNSEEISEELRGTRLMMFSEKQNDFIDKISKEFVNLGVNFQNIDMKNSNKTTALIQMIASIEFYNIIVFDVDVFADNTSHIAGTLRAISPDVKIIALAEKNNDKLLTGFDDVIYKPITYQRFIKKIEAIYANKLFVGAKNIDYSNLNILVVEDVEINREYEKEMLNNFFSISCDTANDGLEAVNKAKANKYDAILMDMRMPVMDGVEATKAIRLFDKTTPIICMSANVYKEDKIAAESSGMNDFIEKPLSKADIKDKLTKIINPPLKEVIVETQNETTKEISRQKTSEDMKQMILNHLNSNFNTEVSNKLFIQVIESIDEYVNRIDTHFINNNTSALAEDFHALKGICANIGLKEIANDAGILQKLSEDGDILAISAPKDKLINTMQVLLSIK